MHNVPSAYAADEVLNGAGAIGANERGDKGGKDVWISGGSVILVNVPGIAEKVEGEETRSIGAPGSWGVGFLEDPFYPE